MGAYTYTMRKGTKTVDGIEIAQYKYAFKPSFWNVTRAENMMMTKAEDAFDHNYKVPYVVYGEWEYAESEEGLLIHHNDRKTGVIIDDAPRSAPVGILRKNGRKFYIEWIK